MREARLTAEARASEPRQAPQPHDKTSLSTADVNRHRRLTSVWRAILTMGVCSNL
jgi:hypothetical protein